MTARTRTLAVVGALALAPFILSACSSTGAGGTAANAERDESSGEITEAAEADIFSLQVGDCLDYDSLSSDELSSASTIPCSDAHDSELYAETELAAGDYPTDVGDQATEFCLAEFETFVGLSYEESSLDVLPLYPTQDGWEQIDDRVIQCILVSPDEVTGTLQGSGL